MRLDDLLACAGLPAVAEGRYRDLRITGIACDSRAVEPGNLFVAVKGVRQDGSVFIPEAVQKGAAAVLTEGPASSNGVPVILVPDCRGALAQSASAFYGEPSKKLRVVGITGTNGKTTCSYLLEYLIAGQGVRPGVIGTVSTRYGTRQFPASQTTPGPLHLQATLKAMAEAGCREAVLEVSSHALDQNRAGGIVFETALFTNLTQDHLDYHRTLDSYFESKAKLFTGVAPDKTCVLNADDPWTQRLRSKLRSRVLTYGVGGAADLTARDVEPDLYGTRFKVGFKGKKIPVRMPLAGMHNVYNALGSLGVLSVLGFDAERGAAALERFPGVPGRLEAIEAGQNFRVFVDYAHTPDGLNNVLSALRPFRKNRLLVLFGCGGDRDRDKRPRMGEIAARHGDHLYLTSDNPRSEDPAVIAREIQSGFPPGFKSFTVIPDRKKAIRRMLLSARPGDIVLLAGKGHETEQILRDRTVACSDAEEARRVLSGY